MTNQREHPEIAEYEWIDDEFRVEESRWKTWKSFHKNGNELITSLTQESCISATRFYLKCKQDGFEDSKTYEGSVGGKL
jgi:predicted HicB family RNase H-like nuclease